MLMILADLLERMVALAQHQHPLEACGIVAAPNSGPRAGLPLRLIEMHNQAQSATWFSFDPQQQLQVWREMEANDETPVVQFHSHTASRAWPSADDIAYASDPLAHYLIISTDPRQPEVRSFRIRDGAVIEEAIRSVSSYEVAHLAANPAPTTAATLAA
ncbi:MAG: hypothetical protein RL748_2441 [Pseudomonadota bacterium]|jgi:proteasome lid subunit RPN8/RPN11